MSHRPDDKLVYLEYAPRLRLCHAWGRLNAKGKATHVRGGLGDLRRLRKEGELYRYFRTVEEVKQAAISHDLGIIQIYETAEHPEHYADRIKEHRDRIEQIKKLELR